jgi:hypothetical protein
MDHLGGILFEVSPVNPHLIETTVRSKWNVELTYLVSLGVIGVEVVFSVEDRARCDFTVESSGDQQPELDCAAVRDGKHTGMTQADRTGVDVWFVAE